MATPRDEIDDLLDNLADHAGLAGLTLDSPIHRRQARRLIETDLTAARRDAFREAAGIARGCHETWNQGAWRRDCTCALNIAALFDARAEGT